MKTRREIVGLTSNESYEKGRQAERKRISLDLEPINEIIREIEGNYKMIDNVPQHIITLIKRWRDFRKKEVRRNDR